MATKPVKKAATKKSSTGAKKTTTGAAKKPAKKPAAKPAKKAEPKPRKNMGTKEEPAKAPEMPAIPGPIEQRVRHAVDAALDRKAFSLDVLAVGNLTSIGDYFLICSGNSERQTTAIADAIEEKVRVEDGVKPILVEGKTPGRWVLLDYGDFIVHIFTDDCRRFYGLERLWGDAPNVTTRFVEHAEAQAQ